MEVKDYIDKIKFQLTGGIIDCELDDKGGWSGEGRSN